MAFTKKQRAGTAPAAPQKAVALPTKTTLNLAFHEPVFHPKRVFPLVALLVVGLLAFTQFGIVVPLSKKSQAYAVLGDKQAQLQEITVKLVGYDDLAAQYGRYSSGWMTETEADLVDRTQAIAIIDNLIAPAATVRDFAINNNALTVNISGITLEQTSALVRTLEANALVKSVTVYTAKADDATLQAQVAMTIVLQKEGA